MDIKAPDLIRLFKAGQCLEIMVSRDSERYLTTYFLIDTIKEAFTLVFEDKSPLGRELMELKINDEVYSIAGPFGRSLDIEKRGRFLCVSHGFGVSSIIPICQAYQGNKNCKVRGVAGFKSKKKLVFESKFRLSTPRHILLTEDGSYERKGSLVEVVESFLKKKTHCLYVDVPLDRLEPLLELAQKKKVKMMVNVLPMISSTFNMMSWKPLKLGEHEFFPMVDGFWVNALEVDLYKLNEKMQSMKEYERCRITEWKSSRSQKGGNLLKKLLSGFVKDRR